MTHPARARAAVLVCLLASGAAGLAYEVLWARVLGLSFGHTVYAVTAVVSVFMGGLALGSRFFGWLADRLHRPLLLYGALEVGIGLYCLGALPLLSFARKAYLSMYPSIAGAPALRLPLQFVLAVLVLLVPTFLMGGTLPAAVRWFSSGGRQTGRRTALVYGVNTLGGAVGAFTAGYWALPTLGTARTNLSAAILSLLAGAAGLALSRLPFAPQDDGDSVGKMSADEALTPALKRALLWGIALSGASALACQVLWMRALVLVIGSTTYAITCVLVTVLVGIALGSLAYAAFPARSRGARTFVLLQILIGFSAALLLPLFNVLPRLFVALFSAHGGAFPYVQFIQFVICSVVILVPALFMGMAIPCAAGLLSGGEARVGREVGRCLSWNTWGAIAGSCAAGLVLIPMAGAQWTLVMAVGANLLAAALAASSAGLVGGRTAALAGAGLMAALALLPRWNHALMVSGPAVYPTEYDAQDDVLGKVPAYKRWEVLFFEEGIGATVAVVRGRDGNRILRINGRTDAGTAPTDLETFVKLAYLPIILHPKPSRVAILGLGSGVTAFTAARFDSPEVIDVLEIEPAVARAQKVISPGELDAFLDRRVHLTLDDGRSFLEAPRVPYDVISMNLSQAWAAGISNLFTVEYYHTVRERLAPGGVFCQWVHGYYLERSDLQLVIRSFLEVFPEATLWEGGGEADFLLMACKDGWPRTGLDALDTRLDENPRVLEFMKSQGESPVEALLGSFRLGPEQMAAFAGTGPFNTDDRNLLEFNAPRGLYLPFPINLAVEFQSLGAPPYPDFVADPRLDEQATLMGMNRYLLGRGRPGQARRFIRRIPPSIPQPTPQRGWITRIRLSGDAVVATFDVADGIPFYPLAGGYRPEVTTGYESMAWEAYQEYFSRISGPRAGAGADGSHALVLNSLGAEMPLAFLFPLEVDPDASYEVSFAMRSDSPVEVEAGAGYVEYAEALPYDEAFTVERHSAALRGGEVGAMAKGPSPWSRHSFVLKTGHETRMVHLQLFRIGPSTEGGVFFDNLSVRRLD